MTCLQWNHPAQCQCHAWRIFLPHVSLAQSALFSSNVIFIIITIFIMIITIMIILATIIIMELSSNNCETNLNCCSTGEWILRYYVKFPVHILSVEFLSSLPRCFLWSSFTTALHTGPFVQFFFYTLVKYLSSIDVYCLTFSFYFLTIIPSFVLATLFSSLKHSTQNTVIRVCFLLFIVKVPAFLITSY